MNPQLQRRQQLAIRATLMQRLVPLWHLLDPKQLDRTFPTWLSTVVPLVQDARQASSLVAAVYVREARLAAGVAGTAPVEMAGVAPLAQVSTSLAVTSLAAVRTALGTGRTLEQSMQVGFVASSGAATRIALQGGRQTVVDTVKADPHAIGWDRTTSGDPCAFCAMLASRGAVYRSEQSADFESHDHCSCSAEPVYSESDVAPSGKAAEWERLYVDHAGSTDQLRNFRRAYEGRATPDRSS